MILPPLAERMRPKNLDDYVGQKQLIGEGPASSRTLDYMSHGDWLSAYANLEGMGQALSGISRRASFENKMDQAVVELEMNYPLYSRF